MRFSLRIWTLKLSHASIVLLIVLIVSLFFIKSLVYGVIIAIIAVLTLIMWKSLSHRYAIFRRPGGVIERATRVMTLLDIPYDIQGSKIVVQKSNTTYNIYNLLLMVILVPNPTPATKEQFYILTTMVKYQKQT